MDIFNKLLSDGNELDDGDTWRLNFNYSQTSRLTPEERRRGWKVRSCTAHGRYVWMDLGKALADYMALIVLLFSSHLGS